LKHKILHFLSIVDNYLADKKESEKYFIILLPSIIVIFLSYLYLFEASESSLKKAKAELLNQKTLHQGYVSMLGGSNDEQAIVALEQEKVNTLEKISYTKESSEGIKAKLIIDVGYAQMDWNDVLKFISQKAQSREIDIKTITTQRDDNVSVYDTFGANVKGSSSFENLLLFINDLEVDDKFLRVSSGEIKLKDRLLFDLNITSNRLVY